MMMMMMMMMIMMMMSSMRCADARSWATAAPMRLPCAFRLRLLFPPARVHRPRLLLRRDLMCFLRFLHSHPSASRRCRGRFPRERCRALGSAERAWPADAMSCKRRGGRGKGDGWSHIACVRMRLCSLALAAGALHSAIAAMTTLTSASRARRCALGSAGASRTWGARAVQSECSGDGTMGG